MSRLKILGFSLILCFLIILSYFYFDRALVDFFWSHGSRQYSLLNIFAEGFPLFAGVSIFLIYFWVFLLFCLNKGVVCTSIIHVANMGTICVFLKDVFKKLFGRYFPDTWLCDNASYLMDQVYGFGSIYNNDPNTSFPSGHVTLVSAVALSIIHLYPKYRFIASASIILTMVGQVGLYYHFLSDALSGFLLALVVSGVYFWYLGKRLN